MTAIAPPPVGSDNEARVQSDNAAAVVALRHDALVAHLPGGRSLVTSGAILLALGAVGVAIFAAGVRFGRNN